MYATPGAPERARWEVIFLHKGRVRRSQHEHDLAGALTTYVKALGKPALKGVTLRCKNMAFPPPANLQPHTRTVRLKGKKKPTTVRVVPMRGLNRKRGLWWCPYCMKLRRFTVPKSYVVGGVKVPNKDHRCPMCGVGHRDGGVRKWNPLAYDIMAHDA